MKASNVIRIFALIFTIITGMKQGYSADGFAVSAIWYAVAELMDIRYEIEHPWWWPWRGEEYRKWK